MVFTNIKELKAKTSEILRKVKAGEEIVITFRGKPMALLRSFMEDELEEYILNHPKFLSKIEEAYKEGKEKGGESLDEFMRRMGWKFE